MAHQIETMAYYGELPWHGLGVCADGIHRSDAVAFQKAAGMDWGVQLSDMYASSNGGLVHVKGTHAVVRDSDNKVLGVVGGKYQLLQNTALFDFASSLVEASGGEVEFETAGSLRGGSRVWVLCRAPSLDIAVVDGDTSSAYLCVASSHDGSLRFTSMITHVRVVCNNTLTLAMGQGGHDTQFSMRHTGDVDARMQEAARVLGVLSETTTQAQDTFQGMARSVWTSDDMYKLVNSLLGIEEDSPVSTRKSNVRETIMGLFVDGAGVEAAPGTKWAAYNAVTEYTTHVREVRITKARTRVLDSGNDDESFSDAVLSRAVREARLESSWFGASRDMNTRALELLTV